MTRREQLLCRTVFGNIQDAQAQRVIRQLFDLGLIDLKVCERIAIRNLTDQLFRQGIGRCEALHQVAEQLCISYEKARNSYYSPLKISIHECANSNQ